MVYAMLKIQVISYFSFVVNKQGMSFRVRNKKNIAAKTIINKIAFNI